MNTAADLSTDLGNPFPGLRPFKEGEEHFFFGRETQIDTLVDKLGKNRFLAVLGSSGSGKSSLVNCGLLPALRSGLMAKIGTVWKIAQCRPSGQPIRSLASALAQPEVLFDNFDNGSVDLVDIIDSNLHMSERGIVDVFEQARQKQDVNLLIVVDQFEELFRYTASEITDSPQSDKARSEATEFIKLLLHAQSQTEKSIYIVLTMRSDFLGDCTQFEGLAEAINEGQFLVPRMSREERRLAISGPVAVGGARIDRVLLTRLVNDLGDDPDQLSILQHALNRIWARWAGLGRKEDPLDLAHYSSIGSMKLALDHHAEKAYEELSSERQKLLCEKLFKALTNKATDRRGVRRPTSLATLCELTDASSEELTRIIDIFRKPSRSFLMPTVTQPLTPNTIIDISHESLMRKWKRLVAWADSEAESSHVFQRLASTAELHANGKAGLWRDPDLQLALEWRMRNEPNACWARRIRPGFQQAMTFLDDSRVASDNEASEALRVAEQGRELERSKAIAQKQQLEAQAVTANKQRQIIWLGIGALILTSALTLYSYRQSQNAKDKTRLVEEQRVATKKAFELVANIFENSQKIVVYSTKLIEQDTKVIRTFSNRTEKEAFLSTIDAKGGESKKPAKILPGESVEVEGFLNQIWIIREIEYTGPIIKISSFDENESTIILAPEDL